MNELGLIFNYEGRWKDLNCLGGQSGNVEKFTAAVPPGYIYVLQQASLVYFGGSPRECGIELRTAENEFVDIAHNLSLVSASRLLYTGEVVLKEGDYVRFWWLGLSANSDVHWRAWGYKMRLY